MARLIDSIVNLRTVLSIVYQAMVCQTELIARAYLPS